MKPQSPEKISINSHEVICIQNAHLLIQKCLTNLTNNSSNLYQVRINNPSGQLIYIVNNKIDILMVSETKLDETFPTSQFLMQGYLTPSIKDQTSKGGGIRQRRYDLQNN